jgi:SAM-dependent methyltransferase
MAEAAKVKDLKGWFKGLGRDGDRSIEQQMIGLERLVAEVQGKTVIDAGCAEGLISLELAKAGARNCVGLEIIGKFVVIANRLAEEQELPCEFITANLNEFDLSDKPHADIVLMLAILHKLRDPSRVCAALAALARDLVVIRLPPYGLKIIDARSGMRPHDIGAAMKDSGFVLEAVVSGPLDEWLGYFRRVKVEGGVQQDARPVVVEAMRLETLEQTPESTDVQAQAGAAEDVGGTEVAGGATDRPESETDRQESATKPAEGVTGTPESASEPVASETGAPGGDKPSSDAGDATGTRRRRGRTRDAE